MSDEEYMRIALEEAQQARKENDFPVGAVVVAANGEIIGKGRKTSSNFHLGHAEIAALEQALSNTHFSRQDKLTLYTTLEPCVMCFGTILHCPITKVVYAVEDPYGGATNMKDSSFPVRHQDKMPKIKGNILREESLRLLKNFVETTDQKYWKNEQNPLIKMILSAKF